MSREQNPARARRDALLDELRRRHPALPRRLGELARYLLDHPTETALGTVAGLARDAGSQPSALVRLAQAMGFSGFSELQDVLRAALAEAAPSYQERVRQRSSGTGGLLRQACALNELSLQHLAETDQAVVDRAATLLAGAGGFLREEAATLRPGDVLLAVSVHPHSAEVVEVCGMAQAQSVTLLALTDGPLSPLAPLAAIAFEVQDAELSGFRSLVAQMCLSQALVFGVAAALQERR